MKIVIIAAICTCLFVSAFAQSKPRALKFDEFQIPVDVGYYPSREFSFSDHVKRLISRLKLEPNKNVFIIYYLARVTTSAERYAVERRAEGTEWEIHTNTRIKQENIFLIDGGFRDQATLEYWIAPRNADAPIPTPSFSETEGAICQNISVDYDYDRYHKTGEISFIANAGSIPAPTFKWTVSTGKIVEGEGTDRIKIESGGEVLKRVTAFVKVGGLHPVCEKTAFATADIKVQAYLADVDSGFYYSELAPRVDNFMINLRNQPTVRGQIVTYSGRSSEKWATNAAMTSVQKIFAFLRLDKSRVTIVDGGVREYNTVEMWIVPPGAEPPIPTPTVDSAFIKPPRKTGKKAAGRLFRR
jgi:hypothetical protein